MATIYALSSAAGRAGVAVVRLSGPRAITALQRLLVGRPPPPRHAGLRRLRDPEARVDLDEAIVLTFPAPHSFTGEDMVELHVHGGRAVIRSVIMALAACEGLRP